ncbi:RagB/SusD family nutrient uptake outer membrane protein [Joostella sp. CR20]|uniref:RagB/SusD family nutrient uptake outer membrane protein n=1 Tax=Joostella sp. CR20 TaxID=2804312 RepID=UPI00313BBFD4
MKRINFIYKVAFVAISIVGLNSCTTDDLDPSTEQNKPVEGGITTVSNLEGIIKGAYSAMTSSEYYGRDYIITNEVRTDNCFANGSSGRFTTEAQMAYNENNDYIWDNAYDVIASANIVINQDISVLDGDLDYAKHLQGQAYTLRALAHFDLLKSYGQMHAGGTLGVPYVKEFKGEDLFPSRNTIEENKTDIAADFQTGFDMMSTAYNDSSKQFLNKYAAKALQSRFNVYFGMWAEAKAAAEAVINSKLYTVLSASDFVGSWAQDGSSNSIFELAFSATDNQGINGLAYIYRLGDAGSYGDVQVINEVKDIFEDTDVRGLFPDADGNPTGILGYEGDRLRNIGKYPDNRGYDNVPVIRYEEVILNYAEALLETGGDALTQLNMIASNRGATPYTSATKENILLERRKELMFEGFRFDDFVRNGEGVEKLYAQQNLQATVPYGDYRLAYPITNAEINANSNIVQNDQY